jgi:hypothetical protein
VPRFHFNLDDHRKDLDEEGTELPNEDVARIEAVKFAGAYLSERPDLVSEGLRFRVIVTNDDGRELFEVKIEAVFH